MTVVYQDPNYISWKGIEQTLEKIPRKVIQKP